MSYNLMYGVFDEFISSWFLFMLSVDSCFKNEIQLLIAL